MKYIMDPKDMHTYTRMGLLYNRRRREPAIVYFNEAEKGEEF